MPCRPASRVTGPRQAKGPPPSGDTEWSGFCPEHWRLPCIHPALLGASAREVPCVALVAAAFAEEGRVHAAASSAQPAPLGPDFLLLLLLLHERTSEASGLARLQPCPSIRTLCGNHRQGVPSSPFSLQRYRRKCLARASSLIGLPGGGPPRPPPLHADMPRPSACLHRARGVLPFSPWRPTWEIPPSLGESQQAGLTWRDGGSGCFSPSPPHCWSRRTHSCLCALRVLAQAVPRNGVSLSRPDSPPLVAQRKTTETESHGPRAQWRERPQAGHPLQHLPCLSLASVSRSGRAACWPGCLQWPLGSQGLRVAPLRMTGARSAGQGTLSGTLPALNNPSHGI